eukprot:gene12349-8834_t
MLLALMADSVVYAVMRCEDHLLYELRNSNRQRRVDELEQELLSAIVNSQMSPEWKQRRL